MINEFPKMNKFMDQPHQRIVRIATTGHRRIQIDQRLKDAIQKALETILSGYPCAEFHLYSALAEGSDQLVAEAARAFPQISLVIPLPLRDEDYLADFETLFGKTNFQHLRGSARQIIELPPAADHRSAYQQLGFFLVEQCDLMIAIWDGEGAKGKGGTGEVIRQAIKAGKVVHWIYCPNGQSSGTVA